MKKLATTKSFCRDCGQTTWHQIVASLNRQEIEIDEDPPVPSVWADVVYDFLQCCGCDCVTMRRTLTCEELYQDGKVIRHFPPSTARRRPAWEELLPPPAQFLIREIYNALYSGGLRLAVMGARTLVDMAISDKVGDVGTFDHKLQALEDGGFISKLNRGVLDAALDAGNATAKPGEKLDMTEPPSEAFDRQEVLVLMGEDRTGQKQKFLPIIRSGNGKFFGFNESDMPQLDSIEGRFAGILPPNVATDEHRTLAKVMLKVKGVNVTKPGTTVRLTPPRR